MTSPAIRTDGLTRRFGELTAVDGLSIDVPAGRVFGFLGPNGAGKTTTIRLLLGLLRPTSGRAEVLGLDTVAFADAIRGQVGALLEHPGLYERLTVEDNLQLYGRIWRLPAVARRARIRELLEGLELWDRRREVLGDWSHGMKQKIAVARTLLHRPPLIFLDEPTAGLDPVAAAALRDDLTGLAQREGVTVFLTTHNLAEAERLCDEVAVIREGRLVALGKPDELRAGTGAPRAEIAGSGFTAEVLAALRARPEVAEVVARDGHLTVELRGPPDTRLAGLVRSLVEAGAEIEEVRRGAATLEDAFLTLMDEAEGPR
jgi:ABC-2 type transport system ATP-binding protein